MIIGIDANEANLTLNRVGINQYAFDLLHALYNQKTSHTFRIYLKTPPQTDLPAPRPGWSYRILPFPKFWTQTRLPFDLLIHHPRPDVFFSMTHYAPRFCPVPSVVSIMDLGFLTTPEQFTPKDFNQLKSWTAYSVRQASKIIAISQTTKDSIVNAYNISPEKIVVTYPGYDSKLFIPSPNPSVLEKYSIHPPYILFLSSLKPSKNVERLIEAFSDPIIPKNYTLVIVGKKAWGYDRIFALVEQKKLSDRVVFTGFVDESEVPALMTQASVFVLPSLYEGFGIPVLESMACKCPVVLSNVASLPEVAGNAGIYVDPLNPKSITQGILTAIGPQRSKFVSLGAKRVKSFNWDNTAKLTLNVLESFSNK